MSQFFDFFSGNFPSMYAFSCIGALLLWMRSSARAKHAHSLGEVIDILFPKSSRVGAIAKLVIFVFVGGFVGILFVSPSTPVQAASAGIAWCRLVARS